MQLKLFSFRFKLRYSF